MYIFSKFHPCNTHTHTHTTRVRTDTHLHTHTHTHTHTQTNKQTKWVSLIRQHVYYEQPCTDHRNILTQQIQATQLTPICTDGEKEKELIKDTCDVSDCFCVPSVFSISPSVIYASTYLFACLNSLIIYLYYSFLSSFFYLNIS